MRYVLTQCRVFTGTQIIEECAVAVNDGQIVSVGPLAEIDSSLPRIMLKNQLLVPGFIDTQVNGGANVLFNEAPSIKSVRAIGEAHRQFGTTGFLPTLISDTRVKMEAALEAAQQALAEKVPGVLGVHLEGPFLNQERKGVHPEEMIRLPEEGAVELLASLGSAGKTLVTLAPERMPPGFIRQLVDSGVIVAAGHSAASYDQTRSALDEGLSGFTHLFNAMSPLTSREPGVVGAALEDDSSWCGIIVDNHHVHPAALRVAIKAKPCGRMMLVTDAVHSVGSDQSLFELLGQKIICEQGRVSTVEGTLAGSDLDMASAVRNCVEIVGLSLEESLRMASLYPAEFLGLGDRYGRIEPGYQASMVLLNDKLEALETWIDGESDGRL